MGIAGEPGADVGEDQVAPAVAGDEPVAGGELATRGPFLGRNLVFD